VSWDWTTWLLVDAALLVLASALLIGLFLRDLWRGR
jgi:hypothetical protein